MQSTFEAKSKLPKHKQTQIIIFSFQIVKYNPFMLINIYTRINKYCSVKRIFYNIYVHTRFYGGKRTCEADMCICSTLYTYLFMRVLCGGRILLNNEGSIIIYEKCRILWNHLMWFYLCTGTKYRLKNIFC